MSSDNTAPVPKAGPDDLIFGPGGWQPVVRRESDPRDVIEQGVRDAYNTTSSPARYPVERVVVSRVLDALHKAGYRVIGPLPEQMTDRSNVVEKMRNQPMWEVGCAWSAINENGLIDSETNSAHNGYFLDANPADARALALALLAAAEKAEEAADE